MARWGMTIDLDRCTACQACVVACQVENNSRPPVRSGEAGRAISWLRLVPFESGEHGTRPELQLMPVLCMHCEHPPAPRSVP